MQPELVDPADDNGENKQHVLSTKSLDNLARGYHSTSSSTTRRQQIAESRSTKFKSTADTRKLNASRDCRGHAEYEVNASSIC